jgi:hypothetical protein
MIVIPVWENLGFDQAECPNADKQTTAVNNTSKLRTFMGVPFQWLSTLSSLREQSNPKIAVMK